MTASWSLNRTWITGEIVTASLLNTYLRDNLDWLKSPTDSGRVQITADFTTTSASYTDVTGITTTITTNGGGLLVIFRATMRNSSPAAMLFQLVIDGSSVELLGSCFTSSTTNNVWTLATHISAISSGSHTIKLQTKCAAGTTTIQGTTAGTAEPLFYVVEFGD